MGGARIETADMEVFTAIARLGSFSAAAAELRLAAPSVSTRIASLERRLGSRLFERHARGSVLTPEGLRFVGYARRCLHLLDEARAEVGASSMDRLVLAVPHSLAGALLPSALKAMAQHSVAVHGLVAHSREIVELVGDGTAHAGFVLTQVPAGSLMTERLGASPIVAVGRAGHPLAGRPRLRIGDLDDYTLVVYRWDAEGEPVAHAFDSRDRSPAHPVHTTGSPEAALRLARETDTVAVVPLFAAARPLQTDALVTLPVQLPRWTVDLRLLYPGHRTDRDGMAALLDSLPTLRATLLPTHTDERGVVRAAAAALVVPGSERDAGQESDSR